MKYLGGKQVVSRKNRFVETGRLYGFLWKLDSKGTLMTIRPTLYPVAQVSLVQRVVT